MFQDLVSAINSMGLEAIPYSGRGMFGRECVGVIIENDALTFALHLGAYLGANDAEIMSIKMDSMGYDTIVYFPLVEWETEEEEEEEG